MVNNADDMDKVMTMGNKNRYNINAIHIYFRKQFWTILNMMIVKRNITAASRSVGSTHMNQASSRSHAIFTITVECSEKVILLFALWVYDGGDDGDNGEDDSDDPLWQLFIICTGGGQTAALQSRKTSPRWPGWQVV